MFAAKQCKTKIVVQQNSFGHDRISIDSEGAVVGVGPVLTLLCFSSAGCSAVFPAQCVRCDSTRLRRLLCAYRVPIITIVIRVS